jgi:spermidine/putrescine transport system permease protein
MIRRVALAAFASVVLLFYAPFLALGYYISGGGELKLPSLSMVATTFLLAAVTAVVAIAVAYPAAYYLAKYGSELEFALLTAPLWVGTLLKAYSLQVLFVIVENSQEMSLASTWCCGAPPPACWWGWSTNTCPTPSSRFTPLWRS